jgi:hypothetical protein
MLDRRSRSVTVTSSSLKTSSSGDGRKSFTICKSPNGSFAYFIRLLIDFLSFAPIPCSDDSNSFSPIRKTNRHDFLIDFSKTIITLFTSAVCLIDCNNTLGIGKRILSHFEREAVLSLVKLVLGFIPFKARVSQGLFRFLSCHNIHI